MSINTQYIVGPSLQEYFVDKTTGLPLSGGKVYFCSDINRTVLKNVYEISGSPPNYSFVALPNPITLSAVGTIVDGSGNDVLVYYYPYTINGDVENYFIQVYDSGAVHQYDRPNIPGLGSASVGNVDFTNYVPNGQFLLHNNIPANPLLDTESGEVVSTDTIIAEGGWHFQRTTNSADDFVTFPVYGYVTNPTGNPRYAVQIQCVTPGSGDTIKQLALIFPNVNKFASLVQQYTISFTAQSLSGSALNTLSVNLYKYYGTGGSAPTTSIITTQQITTSSVIYNFPVTFGGNSGKTINPNNDNTDYVAILFAFPTNASFNVLMTDFVLTPNAVTLTTFPTTTDAQMISQSLAGWANPLAFDGSDLYLPLVRTSSGLTPDTSQIGKVYASSTGIVENGELNCDGSQYLTAGYSSIGIPYSRLQKKYFSNVTALPLYGTGLNFVSMTGNAGNNALANISTNTAGNIANFVLDGAVPVGIIDNGVYAGNTALACYAFIVAGPVNNLYIRNTIVGAATAPTAGNSGFTVTGLRGPTAAVNQIVSVTGILSGAALTAGHYFTFSTTAATYYVWWKINGAGADPAPGGTGILVNLLSTDTAQDVTNKLFAAINQYEIASITFPAGSTITAGSYWTFTAQSAAQYYVWYKVNGVGTDPEPVSTTLGIEVDILSTSTAAQVMEATVVAVNSTYFAVPDFRGLFLRGAYNATWNSIPDEIYASLNFNPGSYLGSVQFDNLLSHLHTVTINPGSTSYWNTTAGNNLQGGGTFSANFGALTGVTATDSLTGGAESRPNNAAVVWVVKY